MQEQKKYARRDDCELQHDKINDEFKEVHGKLDYIVGKVDGMSQQKGHDVTFFSAIIAVALGVWNMFK